MSKKVVISESTVTVGQLEDLFRKINDGTIGFHEMQSFLENPKRFLKDENSVTLVRAIKILGADHVITLKQAAYAHHMHALPNVAIPFSEEELRSAAKTNKERTTSFHLVYCFGNSLRKQREIHGIDKSKQPHFYNNDWWLKDKENFWADQNTNSGWYLLDFGQEEEGRFSSTSWQNQEEEIGRGFPKCERADERIVSEAAFSILIIHGKRLMENWYHWGKLSDSVGYRVFVGRFASVGWYVGGCGPAYDGRVYLRVVLAWKCKN